MAMNLLILQGTFETLLMVFGSTLIGVLIGLPLGIFLYNTSENGLNPCQRLYHPLSLVINSARSIPYIILTVLLIPFTRLIIGTSIGTISAVIPLSLAAALLIGRCVEESLQAVPKGLSEVGVSLGATSFQTIIKIILPEGLPSILAGITTVMINIVGYSAMAGTVGGGGLGDLAIRYGYQRYDVFLIFIIVVILMVFVQTIQMFGQWCVNQYRH
jgi:D-methionine transport system permease protein